ACSVRRALCHASIHCPRSLFTPMTIPYYRNISYQSEAQYAVGSGFRVLGSGFRVQGFGLAYFSINFLSLNKMSSSDFSSLNLNEPETRNLLSPHILSKTPREELPVASLIASAYKAT